MKLRLCACGAVSSATANMFCPACGDWDIDNVVFVDQEPGCGIATVQQLDAAVKKMKRAKLERIVRRVFRRLYAESAVDRVKAPDEVINPDKQWDSDTIEAVDSVLIAEGLAPYRQPPTK